MPTPVARPIRSWELRILTSAVDEVPVLTLAGRISRRTAAELGRFIQALPAIPAAVLLDFTSVDYMSSAGFRVLHEAANARRIVVCGLSEALRTTFDLAGHAPRLIRETTLERALEHAAGRAPEPSADRIADPQSSRR